MGRLIARVWQHVWNQPSAWFEASGGDYHAEVLKNNSRSGLRVRLSRSIDTDQGQFYWQATLGLGIPFDGWTAGPHDALLTVPRMGRRTLYGMRAQSDGTTTFHGPLMILKFDGDRDRFERDITLFPMIAEMEAE
jgi:hypothetical protein